LKYNAGHVRVKGKIPSRRTFLFGAISMGAAGRLGRVGGAANGSDEKFQSEDHNRSSNFL
jgi:hypothetical protein